MIDAQASYAIARARIEVRLAELRQALERHEADRANWAHAEALERVELGLAELVKEIECPGGVATPRGARLTRRR